MKNVTELFEELYVPKKALVIFQSVLKEGHIYLESYDMDENGKPINAHPLSTQETIQLAECINISPDLQNDFLQSQGLLPSEVLYINTKRNGFAVWHTPKQEVQLLFKKELQIPSGKANVPALIWMATKEQLYVYAIKDSKKPGMKTQLFHAPFFNLYESGQVCMGTVHIEVDSKCCLEEFMDKWEQYFWNSYFSHLLNEFSPVEGNIVQLWQKHVNTNTPFPADILIKNGKALKDLIYGEQD